MSLVSAAATRKDSRQCPGGVALQVPEAQGLATCSQAEAPPLCAPLPLPSKPLAFLRAVGSALSNAGSSLVRTQVAAVTGSTHRARPSGALGPLSSVTEEQLSV